MNANDDYVISLIDERNRLKVENKRLLEVLEGMLDQFGFDTSDATAHVFYPPPHWQAVKNANAALSAKSTEPNSGDVSEVGTVSRTLKRVADDYQEVYGLTGWQPIETAPLDEWVMLRVQSGMKSPEWDYVQCRKHSDGYKGGGWVNAQNDRLTDSHTGEATHWRPRPAAPQE